MITSGGNFTTELDELELGRRATIQLDAENNCWGAATMLWWLMEDYAELEEMDDWSAIEEWDDLEDWDEGLV